jgi:hypothetical protein
MTESLSDSGLWTRESEVKEEDESLLELLELSPVCGSSYISEIGAELPVESLMQRKSSGKLQSTTATISHLLNYTWEWPWSSPHFRPASLVLLLWMTVFFRFGEISRLTTLF